MKLAGEVDEGIAEDQVFTLVTLRLLPGYLPHLGLSKRVLSFFPIVSGSRRASAKIDLAEWQSDHPAVRGVYEKTTFLGGRKMLQKLASMDPPLPR